MNSPLTKVGSCAASRAASVNSSAARWPADILAVSITEAGSSTSGFGLGSGGADFKSLMLNLKCASNHARSCWSGLSIGQRLHQTGARSQEKNPLELGAWSFFFRLGHDNGEAPATLAFELGSAALIKKTCSCCRRCYPKVA